MTRGNRTIAILTLLGVLMPGLVPAARSQSSLSTTDSGKRLTISGTIGVAGVRLEGSPIGPGPLTDENGVYCFEVRPGWSGAIKPVKPGYSFTPAWREYPQIQENQPNQDYTPSVIMFTISGDVRLADVAMMGLPGEVVTDSTGKYAAKVPYGWAGVVTPTKTGYRFEGPSRQYPPVLKDYTGQDYRALMVTFTISGTVGVPGVTMEGLPGSPVTDDQGRYEARLDYGWSGIVTPTKAGYAFEPPSRRYTRIVRDLEEGNYRARLLRFRISGSAGLRDVVMQGLPGNPVTDIDGRYSAEIDYGWYGTARPSRLGYAFEPAERSYVTVIGDLAQQDYTPRDLTFTISGSTGVPGVLMQGLPGNPVSDAQGRYRARVDYGWSGIVAPQKTGHAFTPPAREYRGVTASQNDENYAAERRMVTISDVVSFNGEPIEGVEVKAEPGGYSAVTDRQGHYRLKVPYGWSGRLVMSKPGYEFVTSDLRYTDVIADIVDGKSIPAAGDWPPLPSRIPPAGTPIPTSDVLVIPTAGVTPERIAETTEDMRVMLQILREKLSEPRMILGVLRDYGSFFGEDRRAQAFYLQGTAAVFVIQADFPRSLPTQQPEEGGPPKETIDPVWQRARQRLYSPTGSRGSVQPGETAQMTFEQFRDELLRSLRHAANLRHVEPNELIVLTVVSQHEEAGWSGAAVSGGGWAMGGVSGGVGGGSFPYGRGGAYGGSRGFSGGSGYGRSGTAMPDGRGKPRLNALGDPAAQEAVSPPTVLTMQARKADVDAFAGGDLDFEQFRQKAKSFTY